MMAIDDRVRDLEAQVPAPTHQRGPDPAGERARDELSVSASAQLADLQRSERAMLIVRAVGVPWALLQALTYSDRPYPDRVRAAVLILVALLAVGEVLVWAAHRRTTDLASARRIALASLTLDVVVVCGIVWLYAFDPGSALWAVLFILPLEGALRFQLPGALTAWVGSAIVYTARELWSQATYGFPLQWNSISFRMGIGLIIALVAGLMARDLLRERERLALAVAELRATDRLRSALVSTLAHDVRNPLTAISGTIRTLLNRPGAIEEATGVRLLESADRQAQRLTRLANDLLELARLEQGRLELKTKPVPLRQAVDSALRFVDESAQIANDVAPRINVLADPERLQQVFVNLASNSLRYGEAPFSVEADAAGGKVEVSFRDHGTGVPAHEVPTLFDAFQARDASGSIGFGLAIVKALVEAQGGSVRYEPNVPKGARFVVTLPSA